jgi:hypothetical protein
MSDIRHKILKDGLCLIPQLTGQCRTQRLL